MAKQARHQAARRAYFVHLVSTSAAYFVRVYQNATFFFLFFILLLHLTLLFLASRSVQKLISFLLLSPQDVACLHVFFYVPVTLLAKCSYTAELNTSILQFFHHCKISTNIAIRTSQERTWYEKICWTSSRPGLLFVQLRSYDCRWCWLRNRYQNSFRTIPHHLLQYLPKRQ